MSSWGLIGWVTEWWTQSYSSRDTADIRLRLTVVCVFNRHKFSLTVSLCLRTEWVCCFLYVSMLLVVSVSPCQVWLHQFTKFAFKLDKLWRSGKFKQKLIVAATAEAASVRMMLSVQWSVIKTNYWLHLMSFNVCWNHITFQNSCNKQL